MLARFGIDINDAENGVFLPMNRAAPKPAGVAVHSTLHLIAGLWPAATIGFDGMSSPNQPANGLAGPYEQVQALPYLSELRWFQAEFAEQGPRGVHAQVDGELREGLYAAQELLRVAIDHLMSFELLVRSGSIPIWGPYSLLRPALEVAHRASWLLEGNPDERLRRTFSAAWADLIEEYKDDRSLLAAAGDEDIPSELTVEVERLGHSARAKQRMLLRRAADADTSASERQPADGAGRRARPQLVRGPAVADLDPADVNWLGCPYPNARDLLRRLVGDNPGLGPMVYRRLSSPVHGRTGPTRPRTRALSDAPDDDGFVAAEREVNLDELQLAYDATSSAVMRAAMSMADATGYCRHRIGLADRTGMTGTGRGRVWPPPREVQDRSTPIAATCTCCRMEPMAEFASKDGGSIVWCATCPPLTQEARDVYSGLTGHPLLPGVGRH